MREINYLLDENVNPHLRKALHQQWPEIVVWIVGDKDIFKFNLTILFLLLINNHKEHFLSIEYCDDEHSIESSTTRRRKCHLSQLNYQRL